jgi:hypothetical protein
VWSTYTVVLASFDPLTNPCQPDPVNDPLAIAINSGALACGGTSAGQFCTNDWGSRCSPLGDIEIGDTATFFQYYERYRPVDDCSECVNGDGEACVPGISNSTCWEWDDAPAWLRTQLCTCAAVEQFCENPFP